MRELLEYIAKSLVDNPDEVQVSEPREGLWELKVAEEDRGKVIGRKGRTAHAIRTLLTAVARDSAPPTLEIVD